MLRTDSANASPAVAAFAWRGLPVSPAPPSKLTERAPDLKVLEAALQPPAVRSFHAPRTVSSCVVIARWSLSPAKPNERAGTSSWRASSLPTKSLFACSPEGGSPGRNRSRACCPLARARR